MAKWFKRKQKEIQEDLPIQPESVGLKSIDYHPKIIVAWAKAFEGNKELLTWLGKNGYPELVMAYHAVCLDNKSRAWLLKNGYAHLMAMINAAEGNGKAQGWLIKNDFHLLYHMAMAIEDEPDSWTWLGDNASADIFLLTKGIKKVKDQIEETHNDVHSFGKDN
jgi:hypothetical protein